MTTGTWTPDTAPLAFPEAALLAAIELHQAETFPSHVPETVAELQPWMTRTQQEWQPHLEKHSDDALFQLARFFTLAEHHWPEWTAGAKNPAIWVCKILKQRERFPDKTLTTWIREHSDNRFIPYGNALG